MCQAVSVEFSVLSFEAISDLFSESGGGRSVTKKRMNG